MSYSLVFDEKALDFLASLEKGMRARIYSKIEDSKENPHHFFTRLAGREDHKLRVGGYRVVADINDSEKMIEVTLIDHRKRVYKRR